MRVKITVYKESGKYYTSEEVVVPNNVKPWEEDFDRFIKKNIPADIGQGFIVVTDVEDGELHEYSYNKLLKYENLFNGGDL